MNKLIVIPARGGSKGIPKKNIYPINGKPLLEYTLDVIQETELDKCDIAVSTDAEDIKKVALKYKNVSVVNRPAEISGDAASVEEALLHAIEVMEKENGKKYDAVLTMQATSPLRKSETLRDFVKAYEKCYPEYDAMLSLTESSSDYWIKENNNFERLYKNAPRRRQERKPIYIENSAYYITSVEALKSTHSVLGTNVNGFLISDIEGIDINEPVDIIIAESFLKGSKI